MLGIQNLQKFAKSTLSLAIVLWLGIGCSGIETHQDIKRLKGITLEFIPGNCSTDQSEEFIVCTDKFATYHFTFDKQLLVRKLASVNDQEPPKKLINSRDMVRIKVPEEIVYRGMSVVIPRTSLSVISEEERLGRRTPSSEGYPFYMGHH